MRGLILAMALVAAPALAAPTTTASTSDIKSALPGSVWRLSSDGPEHLQSGLRCPPTVGAYRRDGVVIYDGFGLDVSCGWTSQKSVITIYLFRVKDLAAAYANAKAELTGTNEGRRPVLLGEGRKVRGGLDGLTANYTIDDGARHSDIWMADVHGWALLYRSTYLPSEAADVEAELGLLTDLVRATAGARLDICARSSPPPRPGKAARDKSADGPMGAILGGLAAAAADEKGAVAQPITFCVEESIPTKTQNFLSWRGVTPNGQDAHVDRLTPMTMGPAPALETALDETGSVIAAELAGGKPTERWVARVQQGPRMTIFGYYDRRPSPALLSPLLAQILEGKARSLGGYDADSKTITVVTPPGK